MRGWRRRFHTSRISGLGQEKWGTIHSDGGIRSALRGELAPGVVDPRFGGDELEGEANPEGGAEELLRREMREAAGGKEDADDGTNGSDGKADCECAEHPFAMLSNFAAADVEESFAEREEEEDAKEQSGGSLVDTAKGHGEAHPDSGKADDEAGNDKKAAGPAMKARIARANVFGELQRAENHEEKPGMMCTRVNER